jgi:hypothetical protein
MTAQEIYINKRMCFFAMNIEEFFIGENIMDQDGHICLITNKTVNSIEVFVRKKTEQGIDCTNWFDMKSFNERFKKIKIINSL